MINLKMEGWTQTMDENTKVKVDEKIKDLMALAKKKKNVLEYQEITDCLAGLGLEIEQIERTVDALERSGIDVLRITEEEVLPVEDDDIILSEEDEVDVEDFMNVYKRILFYGGKEYVKW